MNDVTQADVFTPEEANAFHEGFEAGKLVALGVEPVGVPFEGVAGEAFAQGFDAAKPKFEEVAYE